MRIPHAVFIAICLSALSMLAASARAAPPDLTAAGVIGTIDRKASLRNSLSSSSCSAITATPLRGTARNPNAFWMVPSRCSKKKPCSLTGLDIQSLALLATDKPECLPKLRDFDNVFAKGMTCPHE